MPQEIVPSILAPPQSCSRWWRRLQWPLRTNGVAYISPLANDLEPRDAKWHSTTAHPRDDSTCSCASSADVKRSLRPIFVATFELFDFQDSIQREVSKPSHCCQRGNAWNSETGNWKNNETNISNTRIFWEILGLHTATHCESQEVFIFCESAQHCAPVSRPKANHEADQAFDIHDVSWQTVQFNRWYWTQVNNGQWFMMSIYSDNTAISSNSRLIIVDDIQISSLVSEDH